MAYRYGKGYTLEEILKSPHFKIVAKSIRHKFPFVVGVIPYFSDVERLKEMLFLDLYVDVTRISKDFGCDINMYTKFTIQDDPEGVTSTTLGHFFDRNDPCKFKINDVGEEVRTFVDDTYKMNIIDREHKLNIHFAVISFISKLKDNRYPELLKM